MILDIVPLGEPVLRKKAHKITKVDHDVRQLANDMLETMREAGGVGLAAPQIGQSIRLIVVEYTEPAEDPEDEQTQTFKLINPEITWRSDETVMGIEGCLSIKGLVGEVERAEAVKIKALNVQGQPVKVSAEGWLARIFQHEIDHLDGVCYVDRATEIWEPALEEADESETSEESSQTATDR